MFKGQPKGLFALALANTGERFGYYTMLAIFVLFIQAKFGYAEDTAGDIYGLFLAAVYFMPFLGGILADKIGFGKCVVTGIITMFFGYACLSIPTAADGVGKMMIFFSLALISIGTGLFKGNLQVMVGNLYDNPTYAAKRDSAFSLFYMAINIGAMFAPSAATAITNWHLSKSGLEYYGELPHLSHLLLDNNITPDQMSRLSELATQMKPGMDLHAFAANYIEQLSQAYNLGFGVACISLVISMIIYLSCRAWYKTGQTHAQPGAQAVAEAPVKELTPEQTRSRFMALIIVFAVVIFFWMAFHQNGLTLTFFARDYTVSQVQGLERGGFNIWILALIALSIYTLFGAFQSETPKNKGILGAITLGLWGLAYSLYAAMPETMHILPQQFQQFNPFYVVALTPISIAIFAFLANKNMEPSAPKKIAIGMFIAACGFLIMSLSSTHLAMPQVADGAKVGVTTLMSTYLVLTFAELFVSPLGISFVSKVAPPKYKGMMMGGWFAATAIGNYLTSIPAKLWNNMSLSMIWVVLLVLCVLAGLFLFSMMKRLEKVTNES